jgi:hypothetical protein
MAISRASCHDSTIEACNKNRTRVGVDSFITKLARRASNDITVNIRPQHWRRPIDLGQGSWPLCIAHATHTAREASIMRDT